jgi:hypothetical protein
MGQQQPAPGQPAQAETRKGFWGKVTGIFGGDKDKNKGQDGNNSNPR